MRRRLAALVSVSVLSACGGGGAPDPAVARPALTTTSTALAAPTSLAQPTTTGATTTTVVVSSEPVAAADPVDLAAQIVESERAIRDPAAAEADLIAMGHLQQVAYRQLGTHPEWDAEVLAHVPVDLHGAVQLNAAARREFRSMATRISDTLPAWRIIPPAPAADLLAFYQEAEATFGVGWEYLAAINLIETGMGRIEGLSTAGAQGPMQFLPTTWDAFGAGGDINSPHDAIIGAARYLAHNGFADGNIDGALFRYNNDTRYVAGIKDYAQVMIEDARTFYGFYHWQIYYFTTMGDVLLPVGYESTVRIPVGEYLVAHPQ